MNPLICNLILLGVAAGTNWDYVTLDDFYDRIEKLVRADMVLQQEIQEIIDEFELYPEYRKDLEKRSPDEI